MKSSLHSPVPFLPLFCSCQFRRLDPVQFQAHILAGWLLETRPFTLCCSVEFFFVTTLHEPHGKHRLLLSRIILFVFTAPLHSNGRGADHIENNLSIFEAFTAGTCLPSRCLAMSTHVTIYRYPCQWRLVQPCTPCTDYLKTWFKENIWINKEVVGVGVGENYIIGNS
jgi:hypothetical protein